MPGAFAAIAAALGLLAAGAHAGGDAVCPAGSAVCGLAKDMVLLQTRSDRSDIERAALERTSGPLHSGDKVFLKVPKTGKRLTFQKNGKVHTKWNHTGGWQKITLERAAGDGEVRSGDEVYLKGWTGKRLTVNKKKAVHAKWDHKGKWQRLVIELKNGDGPITPGSAVYFRAHTGKRIDAADPKAPGTVRARFTHKGSWQKFVVELAEEGSRPTSAPTPEPTPAPTPAPAPTPTSGECVAPASLGKCAKCLHSAQCGSGRYCCPYMKKCVANSREGCYLPIAGCRPMCHDSKEPAECTCKNADFPAQWQHPTCKGDGSAPQPAPAPTPRPAPAPTPRPTAQPAPGPAPTGDQVSQQAWEHFELINDLRAAGFTCPKGKKFEPNPQRMRFDCKLWKASLLHSQDMAANSYFSHTSQDGRSPWARAEAQGTSANGENIAAGSRTAAGTLSQFQRSDGHCQNMLNPRFQVAAVGYAPGGPYRHYWTQMFRSRGDVDDSCYPPTSMLQVARREPEPEQADAMEDDEMAYDDMGGDDEMAYDDMGDDDVEDGGLKDGEMAFGEMGVDDTDDGEMAIGEPWMS